MIVKVAAEETPAKVELTEKKRNKRGKDNVDRQPGLQEAIDELSSDTNTTTLDTKEITVEVSE